MCKREIQTGRSVLHDEPFPGSGDAGLRAIELAQRLEKAGREGKSLPLDEER